MILGVLVSVGILVNLVKGFGKRAVFLIGSKW